MWEAIVALATEVAEVESPAAMELLRMTSTPWRRSEVGVVSGSGHGWSIIDLTSTGDIEATGSDLEE